mmetsp:Transcript_2164/g.2804  ORF Transcript_2164/g.2804 Transcript_2164/m.2804 type:complete len:113 (-) Transcript_2164:126-464(-)
MKGMMKLKITSRLKESGKFVAIGVRQSGTGRKPSIHCKRPRHLQALHLGGNSLLLQIQTAEGRAVLQLQIQRVNSLLKKAKTNRVVSLKTKPKEGGHYKVQRWFYMYASKSE